MSGVKGFKAKVRSWLDLSLGLGLGEKPIVYQRTNRRILGILQQLPLPRSILGSLPEPFRQGLLSHRRFAPIKRNVRGGVEGLLDMQRKKLGGLGGLGELGALAGLVNAAPLGKLPQMLYNI